MYVGPVAFPFDRIEEEKKAKERRQKNKSIFLPSAEGLESTFLPTHPTVLY
jgi:hypothetical protein